MTTTDALVTHLLTRRHEIPNREIIACLAIAMLRPPLGQRLHPQVLMEALQISNQTYLSHLLRALVRHDLVEYEAGTAGDPGYLFWRVGPR